MVLLAPQLALLYEEVKPHCTGAPQAGGMQD